MCAHKPWRLSFCFKCLLLFSGNIFCRGLCQHLPVANRLLYIITVNFGTILFNPILTELCLD